MFDKKKKRDFQWQHVLTQKLSDVAFVAAYPVVVELLAGLGDEALELGVPLFRRDVLAQELLHDAQLGLVVV